MIRVVGINLQLECFNKFDHQEWKKLSEGRVQGRDDEQIRVKCKLNCLTTVLVMSLLLIIM